jgi:hypothetical protein
MTLKETVKKLEDAQTVTGAQALKHERQLEEHENWLRENELAYARHREAVERHDRMVQDHDRMMADASIRMDRVEATVEKLAEGLRDLGATVKAFIDSQRNGNGHKNN